MMKPRYTRKAIKTACQNDKNTTDLIVINLYSGLISARSNVRFEDDIPNRA